MAARAQRPRHKHAAALVRNEPVHLQTNYQTRKQAASCNRRWCVQLCEYGSWGQPHGRPLPLPECASSPHCRQRTSGRPTNKTARDKDRVSERGCNTAASVCALAFSHPGSIRGKQAPVPFACIPACAVTHRSLPTAGRSARRRGVIRRTSGGRGAAAASTSVREQALQNTRWLFAERRPLQRRHSPRRTAWLQKWGGKWVGVGE